jgi:hypothetical protein
MQLQSMDLGWRQQKTHLGGPPQAAAHMNRLGAQRRQRLACPQGLGAGLLEGAMPTCQETQAQSLTQPQNPLKVTRHHAGQLSQ